MNSKLSKIMILTLSFNVLLLESCGGKKANKINTSGSSSSSPFNSGNPAFSANPDIVNQVQTLKTSQACSNGRARLNNDVSFYITPGIATDTRINGNWTPGFLSNGTIANLYVGVSYYRDLMFVTKVTSGSKVIGYNVTLSFCEMTNANPALPSVLSNDRAITRFQTPEGIVLDTNTYCGYGVVDFARYTMVVSEKSSTYPNLTSDFPIYTSYTKPVCNGKF